MDNCEEQINESEDEIEVLQILHTGFENLKNEGDVFGSSTALLCDFNHENGMLNVVNIGDSRISVFRQGGLFFKSKEQQHYFNCPYQLSHSPPDLKDSNISNDVLNDADIIDIQLQEGDIIIAATDGLSDNLFDEEIAKVIMQSEGELPKMALGLNENSWTNSMDREKSTPFSEACNANLKEKGIESEMFLGGKQDDITLVVAKVIFCE